MSMNIFHRFAVSIALAATVLCAEPAHAIKTVLTFDQYPNGTVLTNQYPGVTFTGAKVLNCSPSLCGGIFTPVSGTNVLTSSLTSGIVTAVFNQAVIGQVQSVSAYITGATSAITLAAYDANGNLLTSIETAGPNSRTPNTLLEVSSATPIHSVKIHDRGFSLGAASGERFSVDDFSYTWIATAQTCAQLSTNLFTTINSIPLADFTVQRTAVADKRGMVLSAANIEKMIAQGKPRYLIQSELTKLRNLAISTLVNGIQRNRFLITIDKVYSTITTC